MTLRLKGAVVILSMLLMNIALSNQHSIELRQKRQVESTDLDKSYESEMEDDLAHETEIVEEDTNQDADLDDEIHEEVEAHLESTIEPENKDHAQEPQIEKTSTETMEHEGDNEEASKNEENQVQETTVSTTVQTSTLTSTVTSSLLATSENKEEKEKEEILEGDKIVLEYESEQEPETTTSTSTRSSIWFKPTKSKTIINDSYNDESHISANCPSLNCEFGYKTDLFGKPICACFNPCYEKKCGTNICKIEKLSETKFIGACYDPSKIERPLHCHLPLATGNCKNYTSRFYFNSFTQRCSHFIFTGCNGNGNNFESWEKCEMECNTCSLPAAPGPCHGNIIRYYFDAAKRECQAFNWGGCKGNENNFSTRKHCEDSCLFRKEGALFLNGMPKVFIRKYHSNPNEEAKKANQN